jgi:hypothetical protein
MMLFILYVFIHGVNSFVYSLIIIGFTFSIIIVFITAMLFFVFYVTIIIIIFSFIGINQHEIIPQLFYILKIYSYNNFK